MDIQSVFGSMVFSDSVMKERLPREIYDEFQNSIKQGKSLELPVANIIAREMKDWAIEKGATHYTHWFQPMTGMTAEKHDSFITVSANGVIMDFSGKELIKGEPDASSFPSGGLRATFEARGYTSWDPTSYAFIKDGTLCIPTAFCSYSGEALDKKTPLLRSMEAIGNEVKRLMKAIGDECDSVQTTIGAEQEYFLVDRAAFKKRRDLIFTGRTLFGAMPPKGQELEDHYFGAIRPRVSLYMKALDEELWKLGVFAKTEHNEVAPSQHELAPIFTTANVAVDHNQLTMEMMKKVAAKFDLACLLHEKPFAGVNGSGKHENWSVGINDKVNLFKPGDNPRKNYRYLLSICAVISAVDEYQELLRLTCASAGNDHRLGANEAPPAIISMFIGDELCEIFDSICQGSEYINRDRAAMETGVHVLPQFKRDSTDRNRTSPFAYTGNKFEFRMPGSSFSVADSTTVLNTIVADVLMRFSDELENASDIPLAIEKLIAREYTAHKRIVFNGNNYAPEWLEEAKKRGLLNLPSVSDAIPYLISEKSIKLFKRHKIFTENELRSRCEIYLENYCKVVNIEALTMISMTHQEIIPAIEKYTAQICNAGKVKKELSGSISTKFEENYANRLSDNMLTISERLEILEKCVAKIKEIQNTLDCARYYKSDVIPAMDSLREICDEQETLVSREAWPFPSYGEILFSF
ncbi:MAG: glutamine synthetase III [Oscillospiraceae bacterium]|nr:glutamine synthetase III [Oscillospiraceae bacterium]